MAKIKICTHSPIESNQPISYIIIIYIGKLKCWYILNTSLIDLQPVEWWLQLQLSNIIWDHTSPDETNIEINELISIAEIKYSLLKSKSVPNWRHTWWGFLKSPNKMSYPGIRPITTSYQPVQSIKANHSIGRLTKYRALIGSCRLLPIIHWESHFRCKHKRLF